MEIGFVWQKSLFGGPKIDPNCEEHVEIGFVWQNHRTPAAVKAGFGGGPEDDPTQPLGMSGDAGQFDYSAGETLRVKVEWA
ncbi:MAG: hypothetical protein JWO38_2403 [Gemmataceae bacterium]|nr:hypothetical protein [Gemmataceae bacterium]